MQFMIIIPLPPELQYLRALRQFFPCQKKKTDKLIKILMMGPEFIVSDKKILFIIKNINNFPHRSLFFPCGLIILGLV